MALVAILPLAVLLSACSWLDTGNKDKITAPEVVDYTGELVVGKWTLTNGVNSGSLAREYRADGTYTTYDTQKEVNGVMTPQTVNDTYKLIKDASGLHIKEYYGYYTVTFSQDGNTMSFYGYAGMVYTRMTE